MEIHTTRIPGAGLSLAADVAGPEDGVPVILLHGGGQTRHAWSGALTALARSGHRAFSVDLRGHGDSDWADDGDYDPQAFAADVQAITESLQQPPVLVGASLGGAASLLAIGQAARDGRSAPARGLVLVDVAPRLEKEGVGQIRDFMTRHMGGFASLDEAAAAIADYTPNRQRATRPEGLMKNLRHGDDGRLYWHWDPRFILGVNEEAHDVHEEAMGQAAHHVKVPVMLVWGRQSNVISSDSVRDLSERIPHANVVDIASAGHMVVGDRNDAFNHAVIDFIAALDEAAGASKRGARGSPPRAGLSESLPASQPAPG